METVVTLPRSRALTRVDLEAMPDDGHRYELVDGTLIVTPAPSPRHQTVVVRLSRLLLDQCPAGLTVLVAPLDVALADDTVVQPDVLVARRSDLTERDLPAAPLLAVEVTSPSTRRVDELLKRSRYEAAGCPSYWAIDPDEPSLTAWELRGGEYVEVAHVAGDEEYAAQSPYRKHSAVSAWGTDLWAGVLTGGLAGRIVVRRGVCSSGGGIRRCPGSSEDCFA